MALPSRRGGNIETRTGGEEMKKEQMVGARLSPELVRSLELIGDVEQS